MNENIVQFLKLVEKDNALAAKLSAMKDPEEAFALASSIQGGFTKEEFVEEMDRINRGEITEDDLAQLSGGGDTISGVMSTVTMAVLAAV